MTGPRVALWLRVAQLSRGWLSALRIWITAEASVIIVDSIDALAANLVMVRKCSSRLQELTLRDCHSPVLDGQVGELARSFPALRKVDLQGFIVVIKEDVAALCRCPSIIELNLKGTA